jgi:hypothetical protein
LYELSTRGGKPYFNFSNETTAEKVVSGYRLEKPNDCPDDVYTLMRECWDAAPSKRPLFPDIINRIDIMIKNRHPQEPIQEKGNFFYLNTNVGSGI